MKNSVSDRHLYAETDDDDVVDEDEVEDGKAGDESDPDSSSSSSSSCGSPRQSRPGSYTTNWPQSYRQSIDIYTSVTPSTIGFLGTPTLSRLGSSFLTSSFQGKHTSEIISSLIKPLLPTTVTAPAEQEREEERRSSHALLPPIPTRRPSVRKIKDEHKASKTSHELPISRECTYGQAVLNGINVLCGVGILSTPYAIKEGGWAGLSVLFLLAVLCWYTGILLRHCLDSEPGLETYPDIGQAAFGTVGRIVISVVLYLELYGCCVEYIILESDNLTSLFPHAQLNLWGLQLTPHVFFAVLTTIIVIPSTWLRDLSLLSYLSAGGVIASILVVVCLFWVGLVDQVGYVNKGSVLDFKGLPIAIGLYGYCYSGHSVFPNIYSSLKNRGEYPSVLSTTFTICTLMFAGVAVMGYMMFGESTQSQYTLNLPHDLLASRIAVWTTVVNPITKYALTLTPLALSLEELIPINQRKTHVYAIMIRTALAISTLFVALSVPFFGLVMSLIGSFLTMLVCLIFPCACFLSILRGKITRIQASACILIIIIGAVLCVVGTVSSVSRIIQGLS